LSERWLEVAGGCKIWEKSTGGGGWGNEDFVLYKSQPEPQIYWYGVLDLRWPINKFTGQAVLRVLFGGFFSRKTLKFLVFYGPGRYKGSSRNALINTFCVFKNLHLSMRKYFMLPM
jgi:hypothetical protein